MRTIGDLLDYHVNTDFVWEIEERPTRFYIFDFYTKDLLLEGEVENLRKFIIPPVRRTMIVDIQFRGPEVGVLHIKEYRLNPQADQTIIDIQGYYEFQKERMSGRGV